MIAQSLDRPLDTPLLAIERLLRATCLDPANAKVMALCQSPWASATFSGTRVTATLHFRGEDVATGEAIMDAVSSGSFGLADAIVCDAQVLWSNHAYGGDDAASARLSCQIELLLLDDAA